MCFNNQKRNDVRYVGFVLRWLSNDMTSRLLILCYDIPYVFHVQRMFVSYYPPPLFRLSGVNVFVNVSCIFLRTLVSSTITGAPEGLVSLAPLVTVIVLRQKYGYHLLWTFFSHCAVCLIGTTHYFSHIRFLFDDKNQSINSWHCHINETENIGLFVHISL